jgi:alpha-galactosidase
MTFHNIIRSPDVVFLESDHGIATLEKSPGGVFGMGAVALTCELAGTEMNVFLSAPSAAVRRVHLRWNETISPAKGDIRLLGDHWERGYGDLEWRGIVPERVMPWYFLLSTGGLTHGHGVKTGCSSLASWRVDDSGVSLWLDLRCGGDPVMLGNRRLLAATVVSRQGIAGETPFKAAHAFCKSLCPSPRRVAEPVYGGNNWYYAYGNSSHQNILQDTGLMVELAPDGANRPFMTIDDGWQASSGHNGGASGGPWDHGNDTFPDMPGLAAAISRNGARPGIWLRPLAVSAETAASRLLPAARAFRGGGMPPILDPSIPENLAQVSSDIRRIADWGYKLIKHDFTTYDILGRWGLDFGGSITNDGWHFADRSRTSAEIIVDLYRSIRDAAGESLVIGCNTAGHLGAGLVEIQRTGDDTSGREWERTRKMGINTLAFRMPQHTAFFESDADCVGITDAVPWALNAQWLDLLSRSGTPLFVSVSPKTIDGEQRQAIKSAFVTASQRQMPGEPLDWQGTTCPTRWKFGKVVRDYDWYAESGIANP